MSGNKEITTTSGGNNTSLDLKRVPHVSERSTNQRNKSGTLLVACLISDSQLLIIFLGFHVLVHVEMRWMCGKTVQDRITHENIRGAVEISSIEDKMRENRLRWFGYVLRRLADMVVRMSDMIGYGGW